jgi:hypothetical protein
MRKKDDTGEKERFASTITDTDQQIPALQLLQNQGHTLQQLHTSVLTYAITIHPFFLDVHKNVPRPIIPLGGEAASKGKENSFPSGPASDQNVLMTNSGACSDSSAHSEGFPPRLIYIPTSMKPSRSWRKREETRFQPDNEQGVSGLVDTILTSEIR